MARSPLPRELADGLRAEGSSLVWAGERSGSILVAPHVDRLVTMSTVRCVVTECKRAIHAPSAHGSIAPSGSPRSRMDADGTRGMHRHDRTMKAIQRTDQLKPQGASIN